MSDYFAPIKILAVYAQKKEYSDSSKSYYIESHDVNGSDITDGSLNLSAGTPLTKEIMKSLIGVTVKEGDEPEDTVLIPEHVLSYNMTKWKKYAIWYRKAQMRTMFFPDKKEIKCFMPAMLFYAKGAMMSMYAMKSDKRPVKSTRLFMPPLWNMTSENNMCWGSAKRDVKENDDLETYIAKHERALWGSTFTHLGKECIKDGIAWNLYEELAKSKKKFPKRQLIPTVETFGSILQKI